MEINHSSERRYGSAPLPRPVPRSPRRTAALSRTSDVDHPVPAKRECATPIKWSIVVTTRNRAGLLERALHSCAMQTVPCEVIVVDDGSDDATEALLSGRPGIIYLRNKIP